MATTDYRRTPLTSVSLLIAVSRRSGLPSTPTAAEAAADRPSALMSCSASRRTARRSTTGRHPFMCHAVASHFRPSRRLSDGPARPSDASWCGASAVLVLGVFCRLLDVVQWLPSCMVHVRRRVVDSSPPSRGLGALPESQQREESSATRRRSDRWAHHGHRRVYLVALTAKACRKSAEDTKRGDTR